MSLLLRILILAILSVIPLQAHGEEDPFVVLPVPAWVQPIEVDVEQSVPQGAVRASSQYLLVDDQTQFGKDGLERYFHMAWRIVTRAGLDDLSRIEVDFDPSYNQVILHQVRVWRDGQWLDRMVGARVEVIQREASLWQNMFDGTRTLVVILPDVRVGDIVSCAYSVNGYNPVFEGHYLDSVSMGWSVPASRRHLRITWAEGLSLRTQIHGSLPAPIDLHRDGWWENVWDIADLQPLPDVFDAPPSWDPYPWVQVSDFGSWADVAAWALPLYAADPPKAAVRRLAAELAADAESPEEALTALLRWVQDEVRYFGIEMGASSHAPRSPETILDHRYGDCKDKSLLLVSMLHARDIEAWPVLVNGGIQDGVRSHIPSPTVFDHVIVKARIQGQDYFVDPTLSQQGGRVGDIYVPDLGFGLVLAPGTQDLERIPPPTWPLGQAEIASTYRVDEAGGPILLDVTSTFQGRRADQARAWLSDTSVSDLQTQLIDSYSRPGTLASPRSPVHVEDDRDENKVVTHESWTIENAWSSDEDGSFDFTAYEMDLAQALPEPDDPSRTAPLALPKGLHEVVRLSFQVPDTWTLEPTVQNVVNPWFRLAVTGESSPGRLDQVLALDVTADRVAPEELDAYRQSLSEFRALRTFALHSASGSQEAEPPWLWPVVGAIVVVSVIMSLLGPWSLAAAMIAVLMVLDGSIRRWRHKAAPPRRLAPEGLEPDDPTEPS